MDTSKRYGFRDKDEQAGANLGLGLEYCAAGIVRSFNLDGDKSNGSGKDLAVYLINPLGEVGCEWRSLENVHLQEMSESDYEAVNSLIESFELKE
ncbi:hypothetical protein [Aliivibrio fischeri]|uniref:hypothetical protein n=1 Tax=Aliivibrio fischeri TaxID=668 RepID=UPI0007C5BB26|nr:hypothetical protein [Aliivibrio fischeri]